ncbi:helix-turn-helix domain-containing protein [Rhizorhabdus histidinilytica]
MERRPRHGAARLHAPLSAADGSQLRRWRQQACLLIALPRLAAGEAVTTIALDLGYESPAAFTTMFKRLAGVAPSHYQSAGRAMVD